MLLSNPIGGQIGVPSNVSSAGSIPASYNSISASDWLSQLKDSISGGVNSFKDFLTGMFGNVGQSASDFFHSAEDYNYNVVDHPASGNRDWEDIFSHLADSDDAWLEKWINWMMQSDMMQKQMDWQEYMSGSQYQRMINDLKAAGLNPWLALQGGVSGSSYGSVSAPSVGYTSPSYQANQKEINEDKIDSQEKIAKDNNRTKLLSSIISGIFGILRIVVH